MSVSLMADDPNPENLESSVFRINQRVHAAGDSLRVGTVKYIGQVEGYTGIWVGVDWDNEEGKHDGFINGSRYFQAKSETSGSFIRPNKLCLGITILQALEIRYRSTSTKEEEDEMYVLSSSNKRVIVELLGKDKIEDRLSHFEDLTNASLPYLGISSPGPPGQLNAAVPSLKELDMTGNLLSEWMDIGAICKELPALSALNLSNNILAHDILGFPQVKEIRILVLNSTGLSWTEVETLEHSLPTLEELHLRGNKLSSIKSIPPSITVQGFDSLLLLNLEDNCISDWNEILKLSQLRRLEQLYLNKNTLNKIWYPDHGNNHQPFQNLRCLLLGSNNISDLASVDSLNSFPSLVDIRLTDNPVTDQRKGGVPRFSLVARLAKVELLNGSEVKTRERKDSEIWYVRLVMSKLHDNPEEIQYHPRFYELKDLHGIEDVRTAVGASGPQKMASGLISVTLKCIGASIGEKPPQTKKLPANTTVGKLKILCESFFKLKSIKPVLLLQEEGSPFPVLLDDDDMASLIEVGVGNGSTILVDEER
ncbi:tubulin-folding cofactor E [Impatiens glandulifera]|uniref:tubulin-folding cofactor E n=1 Tax=Impatiens glandulifera TaxID=253017 RepID=UPI001FB05828|nr:tubulin-folding cofactor E [Impatiens glandulifera]